MQPNGWTRDQIVKASKMWRRGASVNDISNAVGKTIQSIYGYARDNREIFPKRTRGARKKNIDRTPLPPVEPLPVEDLRGTSGRKARSLRSSAAINDRLARNAEKMKQPEAAEGYRRASALNRQELKIIEELK